MWRWELLLLLCWRGDSSVQWEWWWWWWLAVEMEVAAAMLER